MGVFPNQLKVLKEKGLKFLGEEGILPLDGLQTRF
jgi:hypothetical protein